MLHILALWLISVFVLFSSVVYAVINDDEESILPERRFRESSGEYRCRKWLTARFKAPFPRVRPHWLINPETFHRLELDCYNEDLGIALEYQGKQHYDGSDKAIQRRDAYKVSQCIGRGVALVVVPYSVEIEQFLEREFARLENFTSSGS